MALCTKKVFSWSLKGVFLTSSEQMLPNCCVQQRYTAGPGDGRFLSDTSREQVKPEQVFNFCIKNAFVHMFYKGKTALIKRVKQINVKKGNFF